MAKPKLTLSVSPTFKAMVPIPVPGGQPVPMEFTFRHRTRSDLAAFFEESKGKEDADIVQDMASGWGFEEEWNRENVEKLCELYPGSAGVILQTYAAESRGARLGN